MNDKKLALIVEENDHIKKLYHDLEKAEIMLEESNNILLDQLKLLSHELSESEILVSNYEIIIDDKARELMLLEKSIEKNVKKYEQVKLENKNLTNEISEQKKLILNLQEENEVNSEELNKLSVLSENMLLEIERHKNKIDSLNKYHENHTDEIRQEFNKEIHELSEKLMSAEQTIVENDKIKNELLKNKSSLERELFEAEANFKSLKLDLGKSFKTIDQLKAQIQLNESELNNDNKLLSQKNENLKNEIEYNQKIYVEELKNTNNSHMKEISFYEDEIVKINNLLKSADDQNVILKDKLLIAENKINLEIKKYKELSSKFSNSDNVVKSLEEELRDLKSLFQTIDNFSENDQQKLKKIIESQSDDLARLEKENKNLKLRLKKK